MEKTLKRQANNKTKVICITALFMGLTVLMSTVSIPVPGGHLYLCDVIICTAALLLEDPKASFIAGGVGSFIGDFLFYPAPMFVSLVTHGLQAAAITWLYKNSFKSRKTQAAIAALAVGTIIMVTGYSLGRAFIYSTPYYAYIKLPYQILQALLGAAGGYLLSFKAGLKEAYGKILANN